MAPVATPEVIGETLSTLRCASPAVEVLSLRTHFTMGPIPYKYRLTIAAKRPGIFQFQEAGQHFDLDPGHAVELVARNADTLTEATKVHFDGCDFRDESEARSAGERLRLRLRILDAVLGLGLNIPLGDSITGRSSDAVKQKMLDKHDATVIDNVFGLSVIPNDGRHFEYAMSGDATVRKPSGRYLLEGLKSLWQMEMTLDDAAEDALAILGLATRESSDRATFLTTYLALEALIGRNRRSAAAQKLLDRMEGSVRQSDLAQPELRSLLGAVGALRMESFPSALRRFVDRIQNPPQVKGRPLWQFLSACIEARNAIAHRSPIDLELPLNELISGLREFTLSVIWSLNRIPKFSVDVPGDQISFAPGGIQIRVF